MAYVAHSVYADGINKKILGTDSKIYIALINRIDQTSTEEVLKNVLAVSELRQGIGDSVTSTEELSDLPGTYNNVGKFVAKTLNLLSVPYNRTKSVKGDSNFNYCGVNDPDGSASTTAYGFAIISYTGTAQKLTAYQVEDGSSTKNVVFAGPSITSGNVNDHEVLIIGNLTSTPTINEDSNFMFGGAKITFTEA